MQKRLSNDLIQEIQASNETVKVLAKRLNVSTSTISKYRPVHRPHLNEAELDEVLADFLNRVPTLETAARLGVCRGTIYQARRAMAALLIGGPSV